MKFKKVTASVLFLTLFSMVAPYNVSADNVNNNMMPPGNNTTSHSHGSSTIVTEDMLNTTIPEDYEVNSDTQGSAKKGKYTKLFNTNSVENVYINLSDNNWNYLLQNAIDTPYVLTDSVSIGGETVKYAGIKTKGNLTLRQVWNSQSDRFSFTVNFGKYIKKSNGYSETQNLKGLSKVAFNNIYGDASLMKEYLSYRLMTEMGIPTPCYSLVNLYVNNEFYGVYMMVESIDSALTQRTLSEKSDFLVKPESSGGDLVYNSSLDDYYDEEADTFNFGDLSYPTDKTNPLFAYNGLWENDEDTFDDIKDTLPTVFKWMKTLNELSNTENANTDEYKEKLESIMEVDNVIRYFAVNTFLVNLDSYQSEKMQNYALYVNDSGYMHIMPWDYNFSFGGYGVSNAEEMVNFDISNPIEGTTLQERPLLNVILQNEDYYNTYKKYLNDCCIIASNGGTTSDGVTYDANNYSNILDKFKEILQSDYANDPTAFYTVTQYENATTALKTLIGERAQAVIQQLAGNTEKVTTDVNLNAIGNVTGGPNGNPGGRPGNMQERTITDDATKVSVTGMIPNEATLKVSKVTDGDDYDLASKATSSNSDLLYVYNVNMDMGKPEGDNGNRPSMPGDIGNIPPMFDDNANMPSMPNNNENVPPMSDENGNVPSIPNENGNMPMPDNNGNVPPMPNENINGDMPNNQGQAPAIPDIDNPKAPNEIKQELKVSFPLNIDSNSEVKAYLVNTDGSTTELTGTLEDETYTVTTNSLGLFAIKVTKSEDENSSNEDKTNTSEITEDNTNSTEKNDEDVTTSTINNSNNFASSGKTSDNNNIIATLGIFGSSMIIIFAIVSSYYFKRKKDR